MKNTKKCRILMVMAAVLFLQHAAGEESTDSSIPINKLEGNMLTLKCDLPKSDPPHVIWKNTIFNLNADPDVMFDTTVDDKKLSETYIEKNVSISLDTFAITFKTNSKSRGNYWCESYMDGKMSKQSYSIIVIKELPKCTSKKQFVEGEKMNLMCELEGTSVLNFHPPLRGSIVGEEFEKSEIIYTALATPELDKKHIECRIKNDTELKCSFDIVVEYPMINLTGPIEKTKYKVGEKIFCSAQGNPFPELSMLIKDKEVLTEVTDKLSYTLGEDLVTEEGILVKCLGRNRVNNKLHQFETVSNITVISLPVEAQSLLGESGNFIIIIVIIIIALILLILLISFLLYRKRKNSQSQKHTQATLLKAENRKDYMDDPVGA